MSNFPSSSLSVSSLNQSESLKLDNNGGLREGMMGGLAKDPSNRRREKMDLENRGKMTVKTDFANVDTKSVADWRKLFAATSDQTLRFFPPKILNGKTVVTPPPAIFEKGVE